jgi:hypothetical protein
MSKAERLSFTINNFPFDKLRLGTLKEKTAKISDFKDCHQETFVEHEGKLRSYKIDFPHMKSASGSYFLEPLGKNMLTPKLYINPLLHHQWSTLDSDGKFSKKKSKSGEEIETFLQKYADAIKAQAMLMNEDERMNIMGPRFEIIDKDTVIMAPLAKHPKHDKTHPTKPNRPNEDQSKTLDMQFWCQDETKRNNNSANNANKRKYANVHSSIVHGDGGIVNTNDTPSQHAGKKLAIPSNSIINKPNSAVVTKLNTAIEDEILRIPDTNMLIYTRVYDMTNKKANRNSLISGGGKGKKEDPPEPIKDYRELIPFIYNSGSHPNASTVRVDMLILVTILGPTIHWIPSTNEGSPGTIRFTICDLIILESSRKQYSKGLNEERYKKIQQEREELKKTFGFEDEDEDDEDGDSNNDQLGGDTQEFGANQDGLLNEQEEEEQRLIREQQHLQQFISAADQYDYNSY